MKKLVTAAALGMAMMASSVQANEISLVSGLYKSEKKKDDGNNAGGKQEITIGARYGAVLEAPFEWFVQPLLTMRSYDAPEDGKAPSSSTSLKLAGGVRWYFPAFATNFTPFLSGSAGYLSDKNAEPNKNTQTETSGLFYWGTAGFRMTLTSDFFFDLETQLFESALFATTKTEAVDDDAKGAQNDTEDTRTELYVDTSDDLFTTSFGVGVKF